MDHPKEMDTSTNRESDVVAEALSYARKAEELRGIAIKHLLEQQSQIENNLKALGHPLSTNGNGLNHKPITDNQKPDRPAQKEHLSSTKRFKDVKLAEIGRILLKEHKSLHGTEIEQLAREGGFKGSENHFQNYLRVAFGRDQGFEKIGRNVWKLKEHT